MPAATRRPLWAALAFLLGALAVTLPVMAQTPPDPGQKKGEEEEAPKDKKAPKKIEVPDDPTPPTTPGEPGKTPPEQETEGGAYVAKLDDVARAAAAAPHPAIKTFLTPYAIAFDRVLLRSFKKYRITPVPFLWGKDRFPTEFGLAPIEDDNSIGDVRAFARKEVSGIEAFEVIVVEDVTNFLKPAPAADAPKPADKLAAAERLLTAALFFHDSAREQNRRRGKSWDEPKAKLYEKLTEVRLDRVNQVAADKDWPKLRELTNRLIQLYKANPKVLEAVYAARLAEAEELVKSDRITELERGVQLLRDYTSRFPNSPNATAKRINATLSELAKKTAADAEREKDPTQRRNQLQRLERLDPASPKLQEMQRTFKAGYAVLYVGARRAPEQMSPATARFDADFQAVELVFEGLMEALPDEQVGVRFRPALAAGWPGVGAGVRDLQLVRSAEWAGGDNGLFDAPAIDGTLRLMRDRPHAWGSEPALWLDQPGFDAGEPGRVRMRLKIGHIDPRGLLTFKMLPANWFRNNNKPIDDPGFGRQPFGTGPYKLQTGARGTAPGEVVFVANPAYSKRPGRATLPAIKEVRFAPVDPDPAAVTAAFKGERLHILTDVPTTELGHYTADGNLGGRVKVVTAAQNRRIHILAINHRRPALQHPDLRRGLMHAVNREAILKDVFRGAAEESVHKALTGPFPEGSWATARSTSAEPPTLFNRDLAQAKFRQYGATPGAAAGLTLSYPADDPQAQAACEKMKGMIESATAGDERKLSISLEPVPPRELIRRVEEEHRFDLAYMTFDYRDDWYPVGLGLFLDPQAAGVGGRNYLGYLSKEAASSGEDERLARLLTEARLHRDYDGKLVALAHDTHRRFNEAVPFVPLWQLDRHMVISTAVKVYLDGLADEANPKLLNPTTLFQSVAKWRVE